MDHLEEWEILDYNDHQDTKKKNISSNSKFVFNKNYFMCPSNSPPSTRHSRVSHNQLVPVPFQLDQVEEVEPKEDQVTNEKVPHVIIMPKVSKFPDIESKEFEIENSQDSISQVFFKKMKENEFVDMKLDSPPSTQSSTTSKVLLPSHQMNFDNNIEEAAASRGLKNDQEVVVNWEESDHDHDDHDNHGHVGLNIWKWSLTGIGAICSFGVAAAVTISIVILNTHQRNKKQQQLRLQIVADNKALAGTED